MLQNYKHSNMYCGVPVRTFIHILLIYLGLSTSPYNLKKLIWLPVNYSVKFKIGLITYTTEVDIGIFERVWVVAGMDISYFDIL